MSRDYIKILEDHARASKETVFDLTMKNIEDLALVEDINFYVLYNCWSNIANNPKLYLKKK